MEKSSNSSQSGASWQNIILRYNKPRPSASLFQVVNSFGPYFVLWVIMILLIPVYPWLALALTIPASGFLVRIFIIFHDCGHGSFTRSKKMNRIIGMIAGILVFTPYDRWTDSHRTHHATVGNLDKRGIGDVWTLTVDEYLKRSPRDRFVYRVFRNPIIMIGIGGFLMFMLGNRFTRKQNTRKQKQNIYLTNAIIAVIMTGMIWLTGWKAYLMIQLPVMYFASVAGVYLFYLQHQYEEVIWARDAEWNYKEMALHGSSFFKLPGLLRWFTGNIGYHHIHHLGPTIPNYNLVRCHNENPVFQEVRSINFFRSLRSLSVRLWDEERKKIITFRQLRRYYPAGR
ncbi:MAG: fatty acid desaturase [Bacteroidales bacterium]|jgi:omega-6 fatty acid desaturase (delta-12 desaturase)|nr:fatty acid desaturase [Bacteroidales bacterium]